MQALCLEYLAVECEGIIYRTGGAQCDEFLSSRGRGRALEVRVPYEPHR